jgi:putative membrane protein
MVTANRQQSTAPRLHIGLLAGLLAVFLWSGFRPHDYFTWFLEVFPAIIGVGLLIATYSRFRFTSLVYGLVAIHAVILMVGGHYTYAEVPLGYWMKDAFHQARNNYDKIGHFAQGFVPAIVAREILLRKSPLRRGGWLSFVVVSICLAISASYELFEWAVAVFSGSSADAFLGTQGDPWDTQSDMLFALIGATVAVVALSKLHDRMLRESGLWPVDSEQ